MALGYSGSIGLGTGSPGANALGAEIERRRKAFYSVSRVGAVVTLKSKWDLDDDFAGTITEAGLFIWSTLIATATMSLVKARKDNFEVVWNLTIN